MTIADLSRIFILVSVDESDIGKIEPGQPANIKADAYPDKIFKGKVVRIAAQGVNVSNVVTFEVKVEVISKNKDLLRPEMTSSVEMLADERTGVVLVPVEAVLRKRGQTFATVLKPDGAKEEKSIKTGISDGFLTEVVSGLDEGETVVLVQSEQSGKWQGSEQRRNGGSPSVRRMMGAGRGH